jgi:hypothetical protein
MVLLAFAFLGASWSSGAARVARGGTRAPRWLGAILLVAVAAVPIAVVSLADGRSGERETVSGTRRSAASVPSPRSDVSTGSTHGWSWAPVIAAVAISASAVAFGASLRGRGDRRGTTVRRARTRDAADELDRTIEDLRADPDPGHAVIAAYAWMEDELASSGRARRPSTAPFEYLDEALRELAIPPAPARSLTELFEVARFSHHRVDPSMKEGAITALVEIRDALAREPS